MEIILLERIGKLGDMGDVVTVKDGYARNFLLRQDKALRATAENRALYKQRRTELEAANFARRGDAESAARALDGKVCTLLRQASDSGHLYGSVSSRDVASGASEWGVPVDYGQVMLERPIKTLGVHEVRLRLHPEISSIIRVVVARSQSEADSQLAALVEGDTAPADDEELPDESDPADQYEHGESAPDRGA